jgi:pyrroloquinoline quinone biosynthesis protein D
VSRLADDQRPFLPRGVRLKWCAVRQGWFLLAPERAMRLDASGAAILQALDGERDFAAVTARLADDFNAPRERIAADARRFLADLMDRRMVEVA